MWGKNVYPFDSLTVQFIQHFKSVDHSLVLSKVNSRQTEETIPTEVTARRRVSVPRGTQTTLRVPGVRTKLRDDIDGTLGIVKNSFPGAEK